MLQKASIFGLALFAGAATAGPVTNLVNGLTAPLTGITSGVGGAASRTLQALPAARFASALPAASRGKASQGKAFSGLGALPGLGASKEEGDLGITVLGHGVDGSGYGPVLEINDMPIIDNELDGVLVTPLLGLDGDNGLVDAAVLEGNHTAFSQIAVAILSYNNTGNGEIIGVGVLNDGVNGNGGEIGIAVANQGPLSGNGGSVGVSVLNGPLSGNGGFLALAVLSGRGSGYSTDGLGIGLLNRDDAFHICAMGTCQSLADGLGMASQIPQSGAMGIFIGGGAEGPAVSESNPLLNIGLFTGDFAGTGGLIGIAVASGDFSGQGDLLGVCVLCGNNSGIGGIGVAALSGNNSGLGFSEFGAGLGAGVLNKNDSGNGQSIGVGVLNEDIAGNGGVIGAGVLNGASSGNGGEIGAGVLNGALAGNGGSLAVGALNGANSGNAGQVAVGALNGANSGNGGLVGGSVLNGNNGGGGGVIVVPTPGGGGNPSIASAEGEDMCSVIVKDVKGRITQTIRRPCERAKKVPERTAASEPAST